MYFIEVKSSSVNENKYFQAAEKEAALDEQKKQNRKEKKTAKKASVKESHQVAATNRTSAGKDSKDQVGLLMM